MPQDLSDQSAERRRARQVRAIGREIDARQHDLGKACIDEPARFFNYGSHGNAPRIPAAVGNYAKRAAMIAAVLNLQKGTGAAFETVDELRGSFLDRHDVVDTDA